MRVVVFGATGNVGSSVIAALSAEPDISDIVGVARRRPTVVLPGVTWRTADISRDPLDLVRGADVVINLAWKIQPQHDEAELLATNIVGLRRVLDAVVRHGVPAFVCASSVGAYAPGPKLTRVDESWPVTGVSSSIYSRQKAMAESVLDDVEAIHPELRVVRMRTSLVFQRRAGAEVHRLFLGPLAPRRLRGPFRVVPDCDRLVFQATHADDIAAAYVAAARRDVRGAFNVAADPVLTPEIVASAVGARRLPMPAWLLRGAAEVSWRVRLQPTEGGWIDMARESPIMDAGRVRDELGWSPRHDALDALRELLAGIGAGAGSPTPPLGPRRGGPTLPIVADPQG